MLLLAARIPPRPAPLCRFPRQYAFAGGTTIYLEAWLHSVDTGPIHCVDTEPEVVPVEPDITVPSEMWLRWLENFDAIRAELYQSIEQNTAVLTLVSGSGPSMKEIEAQNVF